MGECLILYRSAEGKVAEETKNFKKLSKKVKKVLDKIETL